MHSEDKFAIKDENGIEKTFYKLMIFDSTITNKNYIIYTDNTYTDDRLNIRGSILDVEGDEIKLDNNMDEIDKQEINKAIIKVKMELDNDIKH